MGPTMNPSEDVRFAPKDRPLRGDVGWLGALLGELLRELAPAGVFETVEAARLAARRRRRLDAEAGAELEELLDDLKPARALDVVRAFSAYFGVVNTAEQVHRLRRGIDYLRSGEPQPGRLPSAISRQERRQSLPPRSLWGATRPRSMWGSSAMSRT